VSVLAGLKNLYPAKTAFFSGFWLDKAIFVYPKLSSKEKKDATSDRSKARDTTTEQCTVLT